MIEKQEPSQSVIKVESNSVDSGTEGNTYEQNGKFGTGHISGGEIKDNAKLAGVLNEAPSNKVQANPSIDSQIHITNNLNLICSEQLKATQQLNSDQTSSNLGGNKTDNSSVTFSVVGTVEEINAKKLKSILRQLRKLSADISVDIDDIELGSIRLILNGSQEGLERLEALFKEGRLTEIEGIPVEDVQFVTTKTSEDTKGTKTNKRKRLVFTLAGHLEPADVAKLKAAITETSDNNEEIKTNDKSHPNHGDAVQSSQRPNLIRGNPTDAFPIIRNLHRANLSSANLKKKAGNRFINTGGGSYNENIQGNYNAAEKPPSLIKAELSREISNINNEIKKLEVEIEQLRIILLSNLPLDKIFDFLLGNRKIEDDLEWLIVSIEVNETGGINGIRDKYKQKIDELESLVKKIEGEAKVGGILNEGEQRNLAEAAAQLQQLNGQVEKICSAPQ